MESCEQLIYTVNKWMCVCVVAAHLQQEAQGQSGRKTQQTQIQSL